MANRQAATKFSLLEAELKMLKSAFVSLSKIGANLMIEAKPGAVYFRAVNSTRSAYMSISCEADFFQDYNVFGCDLLTAVLLFKHVMTIFRTPRVQEATFELSGAQGRLFVNLTCENGLIKRYSFPTLEEQPLRAQIDRSTFPAQVTAESNKMAKLLSTFHSTVTQVAVTAFPEELTAGQNGALHLRSCQDPTKDMPTDIPLHTLLNVEDMRTFASYSNTSDVAIEVTFNVKDFRAMLTLCEALSCNVKLYFQAPGHPLLAEASLELTLGQAACMRSELILSTLPGAGEETTQQTQEDQSGVPVQHHYHMEEHQEDPWNPDTDFDDDGAIAGTPPEEMEAAPGAIPGIISHY